MRYIWPLLLALSLPLATAATVGPVAVLEQAADTMFTALRAHQAAYRQDPAALRGLVEEVLVPHVDLELLARYTLGRHWRSATPEQQQRFTYAFKDMLIRFYAASMLEYVDYEVRFFPLTPSAGERNAVVRSEFYRRQKPPVEVSYRMALRGGEWKAYDVTIEGISVVLNYRGSFDSIIAKEGLAGLLTRMDNWNSRGELPPPAETGKR